MDPNCCLSLCRDLRVELDFLLCCIIIIATTITFFFRGGGGGWVCELHFGRLLTVQEVRTIILQTLTDTQKNLFHQFLVSFEDHRNCEC